MNSIFLVFGLPLLTLFGVTLLCARRKPLARRPLLASEGGWIQIAIAAIGAIASARQQREQGRQQQGMTREQIREQGAEDRRSSAFDAALADYYSQAGKERARKSLGNFASYSTVAPPAQLYYSPTVPTMPVPQNYDYRKG